MGNSSQDTGSLIFRQTIQPGLGTLTLGRRTLSTLMQFDGVKTLDRIARNLNQNPSALMPVVSELISAKLIAPVNALEETVDEAFMGCLVFQLSIGKFHRRKSGPLSRGPCFWK